MSVSLSPPPSISIVIPTLNAERFLEDCLQSIATQNYPKNLVEVTIVDGGSTDSTLDIARKFQARIVPNPQRGAEIGKLVGFRQSHSELFMYLDADITLPRGDWLSLMIAPLVRDPELVGTFTRFTVNRHHPALNRYLSYHELMLDPILRILCTPIKNTISSKEAGYDVCIFTSDTMVAAGLILYRRKKVSLVISPSEDYWWDIDIPVRLSKIGQRKFGYVENAGLFHLTVENMRQLIAKKRWMIKYSFLSHQGAREFSYLPRSKRSVLALIGWVVSVNFVLPIAIQSIVQVARNRDVACFYHVPVSFILTDSYIFWFLTNTKGRDFFRRLIPQ